MLANRRLVRCFVSPLPGRAHSHGDGFSDPDRYRRRCADGVFASPEWPGLHIMHAKTFEEFTERCFYGATTRETMRPPRGSSKYLIYQDSRDDSARAGIPRASSGPKDDADASCPCTFGDVLFIPNRIWRFKTPSSEDHPGVCVHDNASASPPPFVYRTSLCKGTDAANIKFRYLDDYVVIDPSSENGLSKRTAFHRVVYTLRSHLVRLMYPDRYAGRLGSDDIVLLRRKVYPPAQDTQPQ